MLDQVRRYKVEYFEQKSTLLSQKIKIWVFFEFESTNKGASSCDPASCYFLNECSCFIFQSKSSFALHISHDRSVYSAFCTCNCEFFFSVH